MDYHFKELNIISNFDIFNVNYFDYENDRPEPFEFFDLYYENNKKYHRFKVYLTEQNEIKFVSNPNIYESMIFNYSNKKLNFFEFVDCMSIKYYKKDIFKQIKDKLRNDYVEYLL